MTLALLELLKNLIPLSLRWLNDEFLHDGALVEVHVFVLSETLPLRQSFKIHVEILVPYGHRPGPIRPLDYFGIAFNLRKNVNHI